MSVHGGHDGGNRRFCLVARGWMRHIGANEYDRLAEHADGPLRWHEYIIHAAQFDIYLQTQIGQCLRRGLVHILRLNALSRQADQCVTHAFHLLNEISISI